MSIEKALSHFEWRLKNSWKPTQRDIEAYNSILEWKELQETKALQENESFAKLWIHQLMLLNNTSMYSAERSIQVIDEILEQSVYDWVKKLHEQINIMAFKSVLNKKGVRGTESILNLLEYTKKGSNLILENKEELQKALTKETTEENIIKFVESQINRIINKYEK